MCDTVLNQCTTVTALTVAVSAAELALQAQVKLSYPGQGFRARLLAGAAVVEDDVGERLDTVLVQCGDAGAEVCLAAIC